MTGESSADYPGYDKIIAGLARETFETQVEKCAAWVGTPERILDTIATYQQQVGGFEIASLQVNFNDLRAGRRRGVDAVVRRGGAADCGLGGSVVRGARPRRGTLWRPTLGPLLGRVAARFGS